MLVQYEGGKKSSVTVADAVMMHDITMTKLTKQTVRNCFAKAGFKMDAWMYTEKVLPPEELLGVAIKRYEQMIYVEAVPAEEYLNISNEDCVLEELSMQEIIDQVKF